MQILEIGLCGLVGLGRISESVPRSFARVSEVDAWCGRWIFGVRCAANRRRQAIKKDCCWSMVPLLRAPYHIVPLLLRDTQTGGM